MAAVSAGLLLYRVVTGEPGRDASDERAPGTGPGSGTHVLLAHMGGPFWARRERAWSVPKGLVEPDEEPRAAAAREFTEELGFAPPAPRRDDEPLGVVRQSGGKQVHAWAREVAPDEPLGPGLDVAVVDASGAGGTPVTGNTATVPWPPRSGRTLEVPEVDRVAWVPLDDARGLVAAAQEGFLDRLATLVAARG